MKTSLALLSLISSIDLFAQAKRLGSPENEAPSQESRGLQQMNGFLTAAQKQQFLDFHNQYRSQTALGQTTSQPMAKDIHKLIWDDNLANSAAVYASKCIPQHDSGMFAENIYFGDGVKPAVDAWFSEVQHYYNTPFGVCATGQECGHYDNMISSRYFTLGCGMIDCSGNANGFQGKMTICRYGETRNPVVYPYTPAQNLAEVASTCFVGYAANAQSGLCEETAPMPLPGYWSLVPTGNVATDVGVGQPAWTGIAANNQVIGKFGSSWASIFPFAPNGVKRMDAGSYTYAIVNQNDDPFHFVNNQWVQLPGKASDIGVGSGGQICKIGTTPVAGGFDIACLDAQKTSWLPLDGGAVRISVKPNGMPVVVNDAGSIYERSDDNTHWVPLDGIATDVAVGGKYGRSARIWVIGGDSSIYERVGGSWINHFGVASQISVAENGAPWVINSAGDLYEYKITA